MEKKNGSEVEVKRGVKEEKVLSIEIGAENRHFHRKRGVKEVGDESHRPEPKETTQCKQLKLAIVEKKDKGGSIHMGGGTWPGGDYVETGRVKISTDQQVRNSQRKIPEGKKGGSSVGMQYDAGGSTHR